MPGELIKSLFGKWGIPISTAAISGLVTATIFALGIGNRIGSGETRVETLETLRVEDNAEDATERQETLDAIKNLATSVTELAEQSAASNKSNEHIIEAQRHIMSQQNNIQMEQRTLSERLIVVESKIDSKSLMIPSFKRGED